jgi:hypothetical protein
MKNGGFMTEPGNRITTKKDFIQRLTEGGQLSSDQCAHLIQIRPVTPSAEGCEDCLKVGDRWVHLRVCLICGYVGCCNDSINKEVAQFQW